MGPEAFHRLHVKLFETSDGSVACDALNKLRKAAASGHAGALAALAEYAGRGSVAHMRTCAAAHLAAAVTVGDPRFATAFERLLDDPRTCYWAIEGLLRSRGPLGYPAVVAVALDERGRLQDRANAVKRLAVQSRQPFDRDLPTDPGRWKAEDLRLDEVRGWAAGGYGTGAGYAPPARHPALDHPETEVDRLASLLDAKLAASRGPIDPADPHGLLVPAPPDHVAAVGSRWTLPPDYVEFLAEFSPLRVTVDRGRSRGRLALYGAGELVGRQQGYAWDASGVPLDGWPDGYVVVADDGGDPYVIDTSGPPGRTPVRSAEHGTGRWDFADVSDSFTAFLARLARPPGRLK